MSQIDKVLALAREEIGYLEKKTNAQLDDKTANAGSGNFTKFSRDLVNNKTIKPNPYAQGVAWCDIFVDERFIRAFDADEARRLLGGFSAYTPTSAGYFKTAKQWHTTPRRGDIIFFDNGTRICHTGFVERVDAQKVYTIEGNTSGGSTLVANGGCVAEKSYALDYAKIAGYGRPNYEEDDMTEKQINDLIAIALEKDRAARQTVATAAWATDIWDELTKRGIFDGTRPGDYVTRQELAAVLKRVGAVI